MRDILFIAVGGSLGALARHFTNLVAARWLGTSFPYGTLLVNVVGCFIIGVVAQLLANFDSVSPSATNDLRHSLLRQGIAVGFLGALTTFSSLGLETWRLGGAGEGSAAAVNIVANLFLGLLAVGLGLSLARWLT
jgi:CrcB protein